MAVEATGSSHEELLHAAGAATLKTMIRNPEDIEILQFKRPEDKPLRFRHLRVSGREDDHVLITEPDNGYLVVAQPFAEVEEGSLDSKGRAT